MVAGHVLKFVAVVYETLRETKIVRNSVRVKETEVEKKKKNAMQKMNSTRKKMHNNAANVHKL